MASPMETHMERLAQFSFSPLDGGSKVNCLDQPFSDHFLRQNECSRNPYFLLPLDSCNANDSLPINAHTVSDDQLTEEGPYTKSSDDGYSFVSIAAPALSNTFNKRKGTDEDLALFNKTGTILCHTPSPIWSLCASTADTWESQFSCNHHPPLPVILDDAVRYSTSPFCALLPPSDSSSPFLACSENFSAANTWPPTWQSAEHEGIPTFLDYPVTGNNESPLAVGSDLHKISDHCDTCVLSKQFLSISENVASKETVENDLREGEDRPSELSKFYLEHRTLPRDMEEQVPNVHSFQRRRKHQPLSIAQPAYEADDDFLSTLSCGSSKQTRHRKIKTESPPKKYRKDASLISFSANPECCNGLSADDVSVQPQITPIIQKFCPGPGRTSDADCKDSNSNTAQTKELPHMPSSGNAIYYGMDSPVPFSDASSKQDATCGAVVSTPLNTSGSSNGEHTYFAALHNGSLSTPRNAAYGFNNAALTLSTRKVPPTGNGASPILTYSCNRSIVNNKPLSATASPVARRYPEACERAPQFFFGAETNQQSASSVTTTINGNTVAKTTQELSWPKHPPKPKIEKKALWRRLVPNFEYTSTHANYKALTINDSQRLCSKTQPQFHSPSDKGRFIGSEDAAIVSHHSLVPLTAPEMFSANLPSIPLNKREEKQSFEDRRKDTTPVNTVMNYIAQGRVSKLHCAYPVANEESPISCLSAKRLLDVSSRPVEEPEGHVRTYSSTENSSMLTNNQVISQQACTTALASKQSDSMQTRGAVQQMKFSTTLPYAASGITDISPYMKIPFFPANECEDVQTPFPLENNAYRCLQPQEKKEALSPLEICKAPTRCFEVVNESTEQLTCSTLEVALSGSSLATHLNGEVSHGLVKQAPLMGPNLTRDFISWNPVHHHIAMIQPTIASSHFRTTPVSLSSALQPPVFESLHRSFYEHTSALIDKESATDSSALQVSVSGTGSVPRNVKQCSAAFFPRCERYCQTPTNSCAKNTFFADVLPSGPTSDDVIPAPYTVQSENAKSAAQPYMESSRPADQLSTQERLQLLLAAPSSKKKYCKDAANSYTVQCPATSRQTNISSVVPGVYFDRRKKGFRIRFQNIYVGWVSLSRYASYEDAYLAAKRIWDDAVCEAARHQNKQAAVNAGIPLQIQSRLKVKNPGGRPRTVSRLSPLVDARISAAVDTARFVGHDFLLANAVDSASVLPVGHHEQSSSLQNNQNDHLSAGPSSVHQRENF